MTAKMLRQTGKLLHETTERRPLRFAELSIEPE